MRIAVDLDDVLAQTNHRMLSILNTDFAFDPPMTLEAFSRWDWWSVVEPFKLIAQKYGEEAAKNLAWRLYAISWWNPMKVEPMPGAILSMKSLYADKSLQVDVVSARQLNSLKDVMIWLNHYDVDFRSFVSLDAFGPHNKAELEYDLYIDDSPSLVKHISKYSHKRLLLFDRPWNRNVGPLPANVARVHDWLEVMDEIGGL